jgi:phage terminase large subunit-like protein
LSRLRWITFEWRVDRSRIHRALEEMMEGYDVAAVYCDPWKWQDELVEWDGWPSKIVELQTNSNRRMPEVVDRFRSALEEGSVTHSGDPDLRRHVLNARLRKVGATRTGARATRLRRRALGD